MDFSVNYIAVLVATIAAAVVSAAWYSFALAAQVNALRSSDATIAGRAPGPGLIMLSVVANLVAAWVLAVFLESVFGDATIAQGLMTAGLGSASRSQR